MFCGNCGNQIPDGQSFCTNCGARVAQGGNTPVNQPNGQQQTYAQQPYNQQPYNQQPYNRQPYNQQPYNRQPYGQPQRPVSQPSNTVGGHPMAWYKFLIYFSLFAGAVLNAVSGIMSLTGANYHEDGSDYSEVFYKFFPGLQTVDIIFGILCIALAAFGIYVRFRLSGYCANGPKMLSLLYTAVAAMNVVYLIALYIVISGSAIGDRVDFSEIVNVGAIVSNSAVSIAMIGINKKYFDNRKELFVN